MIRRTGPTTSNRRLGGLSPRAQPTLEVVALRLHVKMIRALIDLAS
jgi:hypothetical protein